MHFLLLLSQVPSLRRWNLTLLLLFPLLREGTEAEEEVITVPSSSSSTLLLSSFWFPRRKSKVPLLSSFWFPRRKSKVPLLIHKKRNVIRRGTSKK